ncbi:hypothetical protein EZJ49_05110 [Bdellovibrio bacteriovorus]|uniref:hypothetical protein n=1 Tax=Bdellovibrio bacteriovorus TaxID=959 RepID=UPI0021D0F852|nr:hypothetical protein [Bdellovibrio bacteriovorus]UXR65630.1 hypothetical protein EZJ49_05110 [Bdellovibrio bacteriovorus]
MKIRTVSRIRDSFWWFYLLLTMALLARAVEDLFNRRWDIHVGAIFDYRHAGGIPLYSTNILSLELALVIAGAVLLLTRQKRVGALLAFAGLAMGLTQMFMNQKILLLVMCAVVAIQPPEKSQSSWRFLRWQLLLVYLFSAVAKAFEDFGSGKVLQQLGQSLSGPMGVLVSWVQTLPGGVLLSSSLIVGLQVLLPTLLLYRPKAGVLVVAGFHLVLALLLPDIWAFSFGMLALAVLFLPQDLSQKSEPLMGSYIDEGPKTE